MLSPYLAPIRPRLPIPTEALVYTIPVGDELIRGQHRLATNINDAGRPLLAEDCLLAQLIGRLLWRKQTLKLSKSATIYDPTETLMSIYLQQLSQA